MGPSWGIYGKPESVRPMLIRWKRPALNSARVDRPSKWARARNDGPDNRQQHFCTRSRGHHRVSEQRQWPASGPEYGRTASAGDARRRGSGGAGVAAAKSTQTAGGKPAANGDALPVASAEAAGTEHVAGGHLY